MKKMYGSLFLVLVLAGLVFAQRPTKDWKFDSVFPKDSSMKGGIHGLAVDPEGKIWIQGYYAYASDSLYVPGADATDKLITVKKTVLALYVYKPDGTQASFSPILFNKVGGVVKDTLGGYTTFVKGKVDTTKKVPSWSGTIARGLSRDKAGNVIAGYNSWFYKFDYKTGAGLMEKVQTGLASVVKVVADDNGNYYTRAVAGGTPLKQFGPDGKFIANVTDTANGFSRVVEVTPDGNTVYCPAYTLHVIEVYSRPDEFSGFTKSEFMKGADCESIEWDRSTGNLWFSSGSYNDMPNRYTGFASSWDTSAWYAYSPKTKTVVDSIKWEYYGATTTAKAAERPRAIAFSPDGKIAYVGTFSSGAVRKYVKTTVGVEEQITVVNDYALSQNYPNPFNPTTAITYSLAKDGMVSLKVYNTLGQEVATLVNADMKAGKHTVNFNAANLASGTYIYRMTANGVSITNKMMLLK